MGGILYEWNDLEQAKQVILEGIELCAQVGYFMDQVVGLVTLALVQKALGEWEDIQEAIKKAENLCQKMKSYLYVRRWLENSQVRLWQAQGAWDAIARWIRESGLSIDDALDFNRDLEHLILARALFSLGSEKPEGTYLDDAQILLGRLLEMTESAGWLGKTVEVLILQSLVFQALGDQGTAFSTLERALSLAEPEGYVRSFIDEGEPMCLLMTESRARFEGQTGVDVQLTLRYVDRLLAAFEQEKVGRLAQQVLEDTTLKSQTIVEPLSSRELQVLRLMADGMTNQEIAGELVIAVTTAKKHVSNIIGKLGVTNRTQAVARARELNLL
jgi:LuxR family maltose regulon positive regulatory protein